jgi:DNA polymerase-3 subunit alpha
MLGVTLKDAMGEGKGEMASQELINRYRDEDDVRDLIDLARELEDLTRNAGKHAGGVVIAPSPLSDFCPLFAEHDGHGLGRSPVTQFDKDDVEAVGLVKFDFLGLRTLTIIDWAVKAINARAVATGAALDGPPLDIAALPLDDAATYARVFSTATPARCSSSSRAACASCSSAPARPLRRPDRAGLAVPPRADGPDPGLHRAQARAPGDRISGRARRAHPQGHLRDMVYQEQVMQMAQIVGGYTLGGADLLRRAMGKKVPPRWPSTARSSARAPARAAWRSARPTRSST